MNQKNSDIADQFRLALLFEKRKEYKSALEVYRSILEVDRNYLQAWLNAGVLYSKLSRPTKAIFCYQQALSSANSSKESKGESHIEKVYYNLAVEYFKVKKYSESSDTIKKCIQYKPDYLNAYLMSAMISDRLSDFKRGQMTLEGLLKLSPKHKGGHIAMVLLSIKSKDYEKAGKHLDLLESLDGEGTRGEKKGEKKGIVHKLKSKLLLQTGELSSSIDVFKLMAKEDPELKKLAESFAKNFEKEIPSESKKEITRKKNTLERKKEKEDSEWLDLSLLSLFEGDSQKALSYLQKAVK